MNDPRFPIGKFDPEAPGTRAEFIQIIKDLPANLSKAVDGLNDDQLNTPYREGGWTLRQTVHHVADSHINSICRFKLALTEDFPTIKPYEEARWAELADSSMPVDVSLRLIDGLHARFGAMLDSMSDEDFARKLQHPESGEWVLEKLLAMYAWHSRHHTAHITHTRERNGW